MTNKKTVLDQTLDQIKKYCEENLPDLYANTEYDAIITHLLQSPSHSIPFLKDQEKTMILTYIQNNLINNSKDAY